MSESSRMTRRDRIAEAWYHYRTNLPLVTRKTLRKRERNAFQSGLELGVDYGAYTGKDSSSLLVNDRKPRHLKSVSA